MKISILILVSAMLFNASQSKEIKYGIQARKVCCYCNGVGTWAWNKMDEFGNLSTHTETCTWCFGTGSGDCEGKSSKTSPSSSNLQHYLDSLAEESSRKSEELMRNFNNYNNSLNNNGSPTSTKNYRKVQCVHYIPCQHFIPCQHPIPCRHVTPCVHRCQNAWGYFACHPMGDLMHYNDGFLHYNDGNLHINDGTMHQFDWQK